MPVNQLLLSVFVGSGIGFVYGLLFVAHQKKALSFTQYSWLTLLYSFFFTATRIVLIGACLYYLLHLPKIHFILVPTVFIIAFWLVILNKKAYKHG